MPQANSLNGIAPCPGKNCGVRQVGPRVRVLRAGKTILVCRACAQRMAVQTTKALKGAK